MQQPVGYRAAQRARRDDRLLRPDHQPQRLGAVSPRAHLGARHGGVLCARHQRLPAAAPERRLDREVFRKLVPGRRHLRASIGHRGWWSLVGHTQAQYMVQGAADEDGRRRGAVGDGRTRRRCRSSPSATSPSAATCFAIHVPDLLSFLAYNRFSGKVEGINELQEAVPRRSMARATTCRRSSVTYWTFRTMVGTGDADARRWRCWACPAVSRDTLETSTDGCCGCCVPAIALPVPGQRHRLDR